MDGQDPDEDPTITRTGITLKRLNFGPSFGVTTPTSSTTATTPTTAPITYSPLSSPLSDFSSQLTIKAQPGFTLDVGFGGGAGSASGGVKGTEGRKGMCLTPTRAAATATLDQFKATSGLESSGKLQISPELTFDFTSEDLEDLGEIGRGAYGTVNKMLHTKSSTPLAVKRIRCTVDEREQKKLMMDLEVVMKSNACPYIVGFYGAIFKEGDCWICMELMDASLDQFYKFVYRKMKQRVPENIIGKIALSLVHALNYLHAQLRIIHRDIKPSNILMDRQGNIKLCDFGISGQLVDSIAQSRDAGCRPYMAPERIDPSSKRGYDIRSDVWSLGITLYEISTGTFPYPKWNSIFEQLCQVVQGDPPQLSKLMNGGMVFSSEFVSFVNTCLIKDELQRPKYSRLLQHAFLIRSAKEQVNVKEYFSTVFEAMGPFLQQRLEDFDIILD